MEYDSNELILHVSRVMASTLDVSHMCETILEILQEKMGLQCVSLFLYDHDGSERWFVFPVSHQIETWIASEIELLRMENTVRVFDEMEATPLKQLMEKRAIAVVVPLTVKQFPVGYLFLGSKVSRGRYQSSDVTTLQVIAPEFAVAIQNALQYAEIKKFSETLKLEIEKATADLRAANKRLEDLDRLKDEFLLVTSHNLRTPMVTIIGYTWVLLKKMNQMPPEATQKLKRMYNCSQHMLALINDMLDVSRIENGRLQIVFETIDVVSLAKDVREELEGLAEDRHITLELVDPPAFPPVKADRNRTHEVVVNLLSNAIKFTPEGGKVTVSFAEDGPFVAVSITDTGIGIKQEDMQHLFQKYGRLEAPSLTPMPQAAGTGLGLYICKKIIELSGGTITIHSEPGKGSTFTFTLPKVESLDLTKI